MRVIVGHFYQESTTFNPFTMGKDSFAFVEGEEAKERIYAAKVLEDMGVEVIPTIFAMAISGGCVTEEGYRFYADKIIEVVKREKDIDGIWLHLHGAMEVENIGAGEADLLRRIREIVGDDIPISLTLDLHANIDDDVPKLANIIQSYRTAPHIDQAETEKATAEYLVNCIKRKELPKPVFKRVYMITPGEKSTTDTEPMKSIQKKVLEYEKKEGIMIANYINGHAWTDRPNTSACVIVVPESAEYQELAEQVAEELAEYAFSRRHEFKFHQLTLDTEDAVEKALTENKKPIFITDSGDNTTGGAPGINTLLLQEFMKRDLKGKKVVIASILDEDAYKELESYEIGDNVAINVGVGYDENSEPVRLEGKLKARGDLLGFFSAGDEAIGKVCTVSIGDIDVVISNHVGSFTTVDHFKKAGLKVEDYDILVVKQGYLFVGLEEVSELHIMAMTPGACNLRVEDMEFNNLIRPMYPLDK